MTSERTVGRRRSAQYHLCLVVDLQSGPSVVAARACAHISVLGEVRGPVRRSSDLLFLFRARTHGTIRRVGLAAIDRRCAIAQEACGHSASSRITATSICPLQLTALDTMVKDLERIRRIDASSAEAKALVGFRYRNTRDPTSSDVDQRRFLLIRQRNA
jgi:hypothetical protein